jgi:uncharacterized membrane protein YccC
MFCYLGLIFGDLASGMLSQYLKSRKSRLCIHRSDRHRYRFYFLRGGSTSAFYAVCTLLGFASGYWAVFITIAAEQFGTNLRATVATTVPNFVRGMVVPITLMFQLARQHLPIETSAILVGSVCVMVSLLALHHLEETFHKELDYYEQCP